MGVSIALQGIALALQGIAIALQDVLLDLQGDRDPSEPERSGRAAGGKPALSTGEQPSSTTETAGELREEGGFAHVSPMREPKPCPICQNPVGKPDANRWFPFCSNRCKTIDLAKWLNEEYRIPGNEEAPDADAIEQAGKTLH